MFERLTNPMRGSCRSIRTDLSHEATYARFSRLAAYEDLNRTPSELASDIVRLAEYDQAKEDGRIFTALELAQIAAMTLKLKEYDRQIKAGELVKVVRCKDCQYGEAYGKSGHACHNQTLKCLHSGKKYCSEGVKREEQK